MKILNLLLFFFLLVLSFSCNVFEKKISLKNDELVNSIFSNAEIEDLKEILNFFDHEICEVEDYHYFKNYEKCYYSLNDRLLRDSKRYGVRVNIPLEKQEELMRSINKDLRKEIWSEYSKKLIVNKSQLEGDTIIKRVDAITINRNGKFIELIEKMEERGEIITYLEDLRKAGDIIPPIMLGNVLGNMKQNNLYDERVRLYIAVNLLYFNNEYDKSRQLSNKILEESKKEN